LALRWRTCTTFINNYLPPKRGLSSCRSGLQRRAMVHSHTWHGYNAWLLHARAQWWRSQRRGCHKTQVPRDWYGNHAPITERTGELHRMSHILQREGCDNDTRIRRWYCKVCGALAALSRSIITLEEGGTDSHRRRWVQLVLSLQTGPTAVRSSVRVWWHGGASCRHGSAAASSFSGLRTP
jgi:hypothetical protein